ncbi:hypothetical protein Q428_04675 [Fervidicella metallireducens AeB]|uniref:YozE SAM-like domain-containing protein n=1 Tax=Fervidicella metallireducens AeB TaxID=1403537 RepID=A0A017RX03_9CLOT|nr:YozE family protein [Fervidicella metallireducens]EYE89086.1 hypothetical protein Q428_04675 [Fervidicella metallireducens AeB]
MYMDYCNRPESFKDLDETKKEILIKWIKERFEPSKRAYTKRTSYGLKHDFERDTNIYVYNGQFKGAMLEAGFKAADESKLNWHFKMKVRIPDSFYGFCYKRYRNKDSLLGDFTRNIEKLYGFPRESNDKDEIKRYLDSEEIKTYGAFEKAWSYFEKSKNKKKELFD